MINLGFASDLNTSSYKVAVEMTGQILTTHQLEFDEDFFPYRKDDEIQSIGSDPMDGLRPISLAGYVQEGGYGI